MGDQHENVLFRFNPSEYSDLTQAESLLIKQVTEFTQQYFQNPKFDASHDFHHVMRVTSNALRILQKEQSSFSKSRSPRSYPELSACTVILGALLHDVDDSKYVDASCDVREPIAKQELIKCGVSEVEAQRIQTLIEGVSYSTESKDPDRVKFLVQQIPELAIVQDADRLDAIGAIGIGRCFTYGGAKRSGTLESSIEHFNDKLLKLEGMMKTVSGREMAAERSRRIRDFMGWWQDESNVYMN